MLNPHETSLSQQEADLDDDYEETLVSLIHQYETNHPAPGEIVRLEEYSFGGLPAPLRQRILFRFVAVLLLFAGAFGMLFLGYHGILIALVLAGVGVMFVYSLCYYLMICSIHGWVVHCGPVEQIMDVGLFRVSRKTIVTINSDNGPVAFAVPFGTRFAPGTVLSVYVDAKAPMQSSAHGLLLAGVLGFCSGWPPLSDSIKKADPFCSSVEK